MSTPRRFDADELHLPAFLASLPELARVDAQAAYEQTFERTVRSFRAGREVEAKRLGAVMALLVREHEGVQP